MSGATVRSQEQAASVVKPHTHCRVCHAELPAPYLDLGCHPLANALVNPADFPWEDVEVLGRPNKLRQIAERVAPLAVALCTQCGLSQLTVVVDPDVLYAGYRFRSGASPVWREHCDALAEHCGTPGVMLDIAANDGTCMSAFEARGWRVFGIDPAPAAPGIYQGFWSPDVARSFTERFDVIVAQNVLGHVDDPVAFLSAAKSVLKPDGWIAIEVPHVRDLIFACAFDTIYHEHLSYWSASPLIRAAQKAGLTLDHQDRLYKVHGGSRRYWLRHAPPNSPLDRPVRKVDPSGYHVFARDVERRLKLVIRVLGELTMPDVVLGAFGASAKGNVMLNALKARGNTVWPVSIVDETPEKQGYLTPGVHIPIVSPEESGMCEWDMCWVMSWNWIEEIKAKARKYGFKGSFLVTSPDVLVVD